MEIIRNIETGYAIGIKYDKNNLISYKTFFGALKQLTEFHTYPQIWQALTGEQGSQSTVSHYITGRRPYGHELNNAQMAQLPQQIQLEKADAFIKYISILNNVEEPADGNIKTSLAQLRTNLFGADGLLELYNFSIRKPNVLCMEDRRIILSAIVMLIFLFLVKQLQASADNQGNILRIFRIQGLANKKKAEQQKPTIDKDTLRRASDYQRNELCSSVTIVPELLSDLSDSNTGTCFLDKVLDDGHKHSFLIGEGGAGKTTILYALMEKICSETPSCPCFYIDLSVADQSTLDRFIPLMIIKQIKACENQNSPKNTLYTNVLEKYDELIPLVKQHLKTGVILLLDGLNEVSRAVVPNTESTIVSRIIGEINQLSEDAPNTRLIITGRNDESSLLATFERRQLQGLKAEQIKSYMEKYKLDVEAIQSNVQLWDLLKKPLFLKMYCGLSTSSSSVISTRGEILDMWFGGSSENNNGRTTTETDCYYNERNRIQSIRTQREPSSIIQFTYDQQIFLLEVLLPEIAFAMIKNEKFSLQVSSVDGPSIKKVCSSFYSRIENQQDLWCEYFKYINPFSKDYDDLSKVIELGRITDLLFFAVDSLGILFKANGEYSFRHQYYRDYFAAKSYITRLRLAVSFFDSRGSQKSKQYAIPFLKDFGLLDDSIAVLIGEILREHVNAPDTTSSGNSNCNRNLLSKSLDIYRGEFGSENDIRCVSKIINIIKTSRSYNLSGVNFSDLDLSLCDLNNTILGEANFSKAKISDHTFIKEYHENIVSLSFDYNNKYLASLHEDGELLVFDTSGKTQVCQHRLGEDSSNRPKQWAQYKVHWRESAVQGFNYSCNEMFSFLPFDESPSIMFETIIDPESWGRLKSITGLREWISIPSTDEQYIILTTSAVEMITIEENRIKEKWKIEGRYEHIILFSGLVVAEPTIDDGNGKYFCDWINMNGKLESPPISAKKVWQLNNNCILCQGSEASYFLYSPMRQYNALHFKEPPLCACLNDNNTRIYASFHDCNIECYSTEQPVSAPFWKTNRISRNDPMSKDIFYVSPTGNQLVHVAGEIINIFSMTGDEVHLKSTIRCDSRIESLAFAPDGNSIAYSTVDSDKLFLFPGDNAIALTQKNSSSDMRKIIWHPNQSKIAVITSRVSNMQCYQIYVSIISLETNEHYNHRISKSSFSSACKHATLNADSTNPMLAFCTNSGIHVYDISKDHLESYSINVVGYSSWLDNDTLLFCCSSGKIGIWRAPFSARNLVFFDPIQLDEYLYWKQQDCQYICTEISASIDQIAMRMISVPGQERVCFFLCNDDGETCPLQVFPTGYSNSAVPPISNWYDITDDLYPGRIYQSYPQKFHISQNQKFFFQERAKLYAFTVATPSRKMSIFDFKPGLHCVLNCDLSSASNNSNLSEYAKRFMGQYGAKFEAHWNDK